MRLIDHVTAHPLLDERPVKDVLEPLGFDIHIETLETPDQDEEREDAERFEADPEAFMAGMEFSVPEGFTELARFDTEDCEIVMLAVKPVTAVALALMAPVDEAEVPA
ncbi:hypothetical protein [Halomonas organivorans]|uniref:Uncharacterized protein n=1 Tax=Halomonas organivorans TaxID=257772 RepID=A0A7W5G6P6_9GAMM|nr:hypothetical protein [Halomonas organivorans]MBB3142788.1 hypothetical protein [Halomonas organivorans]